MSLIESICPTVNSREIWGSHVGFCLLSQLSGGYRFDILWDERFLKPPWLYKDAFSHSSSLVVHISLLEMMNDNLRRKMQEIDLGVHEAPIALPAAICAKAVQANRFSIVGVLVNPQKQNMHALIGQMPRLWGLADEVVGRIVEPTKFQFVF